MNSLLKCGMLVVLATTGVLLAQTEAADAQARRGYYYPGTRYYPGPRQPMYMPRPMPSPRMVPRRKCYLGGAVYYYC